MDFTREPIIETIISPKESHKLSVRNSRLSDQEEYLVNAVEIVSFGAALFFRSVEKPRPFLLPVSDYEIVEVKEGRLMLKNATLEKPPVKIEPKENKQHSSEDKEKNDNNENRKSSKKKHKRRSGSGGGKNENFSAEKEEEQNRDHKKEESKEHKEPKAPIKIVPSTEEMFVPPPPPITPIIFPPPPKIIGRKIPVPALKEEVIHQGKESFESSEAKGAVDSDSFVKELFASDNDSNEDHQRDDI